jgi:hypothetical protein
MVRTRCGKHIVSGMLADDSFAVPTPAFAQGMAGAERIAHRATPAEVTRGSLWPFSNSKPGSGGRTRTGNLAVNSRKVSRPFEVRQGPLEYGSSTRESAECR